MTVQYTPNLKLNKPDTAHKPWDVELQALADLVDEAMGFLSKAITGNTTLTITDGVASEARHGMLKFTGALGADATITMPGIERMYIVWNACTGGFKLSVGVSGQTLAEVKQGKKAVLVCDGVDTFVAAIVGAEESLPLGAIIAVTGTWGTDNSAGAGTGYNETGVIIPADWKLCNGALISDEESPFDGRWLPYLVDGRFLRGNTSAGGKGGQATLNPRTAFPDTGTPSYTPTGLVSSHNHGLGTAGGAGLGYNGSALHVDNSSAVNMTSTFRYTGLTVGANSQVLGAARLYGATNYKQPTFSGNSIAKNLWFLNAAVNIEPVYLDTKFYQRIK